jgi:hypothetical protein
MSPFKVLLIVILLVFLGLGTLAALYSMSGAGGDFRKLDLIPVTIDDFKVNVPRRYFRGGAAPSYGTSERVDLVMLHPDMIAAGVSPEKLDDAPNPQLLVFVSIQRNDGVIDPAERVQDIYGRFLEPTTFESSGGLLLKRFNADSPYEDEELFIAPPDGRIFAARCRKPEKVTSNGIGETCIWRFRQTGADVQVRFAPALLHQWEDMAMGIAKRLKEWEGK